MQINDIQENYGSGWIKIYRSLGKHWVWQEKPFTKGQAWIDILLECNHSDQTVNIKNELIICKRGESLNSLDKWAKRWGWNKSAVRRFLKLLKSDTMIVLKPTRKTTHLSVCNYNGYQDKRNTDETQMKHRRNTDETQMTLNKNDKKDKNVNKGEREDLSLNSLTTYWNATLGIPRLLEKEFINELIKKFGEKKTKSIIREFAEKNFKRIDTMRDALDSKGNIKPKSNGKDNGLTYEEIIKYHGNVTKEWDKAEDGLWYRQMQ